MDPRHAACPYAHGPKTNMRCHRAIGLLMALMMTTTGCTSIRSFEGSRVERLKLGELATVYETSGRVSRLYISAISDEEIRGQYYPGGEIVSIPRNDIDSIEVERTDYAKSAVAGVGGVVVAAAALVVGFFMLLVMAAGASA
jgi:hypothetical protein